MTVQITRLTNKPKIRCPIGVKEPTIPGINVKLMIVIIEQIMMI